MMERDNPALTSLLARLRWQLAEPVDFTRTDPETTVAKFRLLSAAAVYFNVLVVTEFGGRPGPVRQEGLVEQVVAAAFQTFQGADPYPSPFDRRPCCYEASPRDIPSLTQISELASWWRSAPS